MVHRQQICRGGECEDSGMYTLWWESIQSAHIVRIDKRKMMRMIWQMVAATKQRHILPYIYCELVWTVIATTSSDVDEHLLRLFLNLCCAWADTPWCAIHFTRRCDVRSYSTTAHRNYLAAMAKHTGKERKRKRRLCGARRRQIIWEITMRRVLTVCLTSLKQCK